MEQITASLSSPSLPPFLPFTLSPYLPLSLTPSLPLSLPSSLSPSLPPSPRPSLTPSLDSSSPPSHSHKAKLAFERLEIGKEYHPFIQGPNNATVKAIMEQTGARVNIPPPSLMKNDITVAGDKDCVAKAVDQIQKLHQEVVSRKGGTGFRVGGREGGRLRDGGRGGGRERE